jgi:hypothetical protein
LARNALLLTCPGGFVVEEFDDQSPSRLLTDVDVQEDTRSCHVWLFGAIGRETFAAHSSVNGDGHAGPLVNMWGSSCGVGDISVQDLRFIMAHSPFCCHTHLRFLLAYGTLDKIALGLELVKYIRYMIMLHICGSELGIDCTAWSSSPLNPQITFANAH